MTDTATSAEKMDAVHDAFTLGWKLIELKSRIQIAVIRANAVLSASNMAPASGGADRTPATTTADPLDLMVRSNDAFWQASVWRATFNQIAALHAHAFPGSACTQTLYEPPKKENLPYLYPPKPDYADVGISSASGVNAPLLKDFQLFDVTRRAINCLTLLYIDKDDSLIPDMIGRDQAWLMMDVLSAAQNTGAGGGTMTPGVAPPGAPPIVPADRSGLPTPTTADFKGALQAGGKTIAETTDTWDYYRNEAIKTLSERTIKFLDAWNGYVRENYYAGGVLKNDETELIAFEAGNTLASLSWQISVLTTNIEFNPKQTAPPLPASPAPLPLASAAPPAPAPPASAAPLPPQETVDLRAAWGSVFSDRAIIHVQHQISALSTVLDDAYYQLHPDQKRPAEDAVLVWPNPDAPGQAIHAVKQSLDYWCRAVEWISKDGTPIEWSSRLKDETGKLDVDTVSKRMQVVLREQADIWQSLLTGQQSLRAFSIESVTQKIIKEAMDSVQQTIQADFGHSAQEALANAKVLTQEISDAAKSALESLTRSFWPVLLLAGGIVLALGVGLMYVLANPGKTSLDIGSGATGIITTVVLAMMAKFGYRSTEVKTDLGKTIDAKQAAVVPATGGGSLPAAASGNADLGARIGGIAAETGAALLKALEDGYTQIRIEFADLSQSVAVTYPLVEFFALNANVPDLKNDYAFLTKIIWSGSERDQEIQQVARAAFGPFSTMLRLSPAVKPAAPDPVSK